MAWYELKSADDTRLDELAERFQLHPLHVQDCRDADARIKIEQGDNYHFIVLRPLQLLEGEEELHQSPLTMFVGKEFFITIGDEQCVAIREALERARRAGSDTLPDRLLYLIFDTVVDSYFKAVDTMDDRIDVVEDNVLDNPSPSTLQHIFDLKRALIDLRRIIVNTRDIGMRLQRDSELIDRELYPFFRDIYDHLLRLADSVETLRDLLNNTLDVYLSSVANRTNQVMKVLTVLSTIALPALVISGIYGMNLKGLPFLDSNYGSAIVGGMMVLSTVLLLILLRALRWL
ncbi:magnesium transporter [Silvibacterium bohemicum]|uniref:Magnesium transport protein CorA n=1 Tax=Silvibacterium bohemicum TaxID=1577686 RepID=A0A841K209_9BACT|nr:magnesium/cobalt transporter CorA [Silvibacterium bohemicum]MBB6147035.1 magnesium transporter [Silvibacterium bohemicum]